MAHTPLAWCMLQFGGMAALAKALGISHSAVSQWQRHGRIPMIRQAKILEISRIRGLDITASDLVEGRKA